MKTFGDGRAWKQFKLISIMLTELTRIAASPAERPPIAVTPQRPQILCSCGSSFGIRLGVVCSEHLFVSGPCFMLRATSPIQE